MRSLFVFVFAAWSITAYAVEGPAVIECHAYKSPGEIFTTDCSNNVTAAMKNYVMVNEADSKYVQSLLTVYGATCDDSGICQRMSNNAGDYAGQGGKGIYRVPTGYYLGLAGNGSTVAYQYNTGPEFNGARYTPSNAAEKIYKEYPVSSADSPTYDLYCGPQDDTCSYTTPEGKKLTLTREELPKYVPMYKGDLVDCNLETCTNSRFQVIGLNPEYSAFHN